jgi:very-short-patch-repair endonuclease
MPQRNEPLPAELLAFARELRGRQTDAEKLMWALLRNRGAAGFKFRRQHPVEPYVLDFYCDEKRLAIELDGAQHEGPEAKCRDERRSDYLRRQGIQVLRFANKEVLDNTEHVLRVKYEVLKEKTLTPNTSPGGRGEL